MRCCRELDDDTASQCPNEGTEYNVVAVCGIPLIVLLCPEHSDELTEAMNQ